MERETIFQHTYSRADNVVHGPSGDIKIKNPPLLKVRRMLLDLNIPNPIDLVPTTPKEAVRIAVPLAGSLVLSACSNEEGAYSLVDTAKPVLDMLPVTPVEAAGLVAGAVAGFVWEAVDERRVERVDVRGGIPVGTGAKKFEYIWSTVFGAVGGYCLAHTGEGVASRDPERIKDSLSLLFAYGSYKAAKMTKTPFSNEQLENARQQ